MPDIKATCRSMRPTVHFDALTEKGKEAMDGRDSDSCPEEYLWTAIASYRRAGASVNTDDVT